MAMDKVDVKYVDMYENGLTITDADYEQAGNNTSRVYLIDMSTSTETYQVD